MEIGKIEQLTTWANTDPQFQIQLGVNGIDSWKPGGLCRKCGKRPATETWASGGAIAAIHGAYEFRCKACCVAEQLEHARQSAARIPELERELAALEVSE